MKVRRREWDQLIPRPLEEVWHFFSHPENLNEITPAGMSFDILTPLHGLEMYEGMLIQYRVSPFPGIRFNWVTEITHIKDGRYFIDEQRFGPYAFWHHQHHFEEREGGTLMRDILHYIVPFWIIGDIADSLFVRRKVEQIFSFREQATERIFEAY